jgi:hypothetical protein
MKELMSKTKHITLFLLASLAITVFFSCKKKPDMPPVNPQGDKITIKGLRDLFISNNAVNYKFTKDISLYATVAMSDNYKTLYLKDGTGAIILKQLNAHGIFQGDSLRINLNGSWLDLGGTASSIQIDSVDVSSGVTNKVVKLDIGKTPVPMNVTIAQLNASASSASYLGVVVPSSVYDGQVVQISGVQFSVMDSSYYIPLGTGSLYLNHMLYDCGSINSINISLYKGTTDFINHKVPSTYSGSIIAAVSFYNNTLQLTPRSYGDLVFDQPRCGVDTLIQSFAACVYGPNLSSFLPGWFIINHTGYLNWAVPSSITSPPGFPAATNFSGQPINIMWLITPAIKNSATKTLSFETAVCYGVAPFPQQLQVLISTDFKMLPNGLTNLGGPNYPSSTPATWTNITSSCTMQTGAGATSSTFGPFINSGTINLSSVPSLAGYTGTFYVGFKYIGRAGTDSTQTCAIRNLVIKN